MTPRLQPILHQLPRPCLTAKRQFWRN